MQANEDVIKGVDKEYVRIGKITGVYGIKGWVKIQSDTRPIENITNYAVWHLFKDKNRLTKKVVHIKAHGKGFIAELEGVDDRDKAQSLLKSFIDVKRTDLPKLNNDEFYWQDLIGLEVIDVSRGKLGELSEIVETGANDVLIVSGKKRLLIPWVKDVFVIEINPDKGWIKVDWPEDKNTNGQNDTDSGNR